MKDKKEKRMEEKLFYSAPGVRTGDVIPKYIDGIYEGVEKPGGA